MIIKKVLISDFQGLKGKKEYELSGGINAMIQKNGSGKSSFLNAVRYAISGAQPKGELIHRGAESAAVQVETEDGRRFCRQAVRNKPSAYFLDGKRASLKELNDAIHGACGVSSETLSIVSSSDILSALKPQEFSDLLLAHAPVRLSVDDLISFLPDDDEDAKNSVKAYFKDKDGNIGFEEIEAFHAAVCDKRYETKKALSQCEAVIKMFGSLNEPAEDRETLKKRFSELKALVDEITVYKSKKASYDKIRESVEKNAKLKDELKAKIEANKSTEPSGDIKGIEESILELQKQLSDAGKVYNTVQASVETFKKALDTLNGNVCPYSKKIVCTTDKSGILEEIRKRILDGEGAMEQQVRTGNEIKKKLSVFQKARESYQKNVEAYLEKQQLIEKLRLIEENEKLVQEEPKPVENAEAILAEYAEKEKVLASMDNFVMLSDAKKKYPKYKTMVNTLEHLAGYFAPKGIVRESVNKKFSDVFETRCNVISDELIPGMRFKFVSENGITVHVSMREGVSFVPFATLSNGEKMYALYVLLDMLSELTGSGIIVMDELSVLDTESFRAFIRVLKAHEKDYGQVFIAMADHEDMKTVLDNEKINIVNL